ncbi:ABC transporter permease [Streptomyces zagrosensis]|uniref:Oligopeptide transport system permease protein OppC n=1 Tax=Streptomyces zagrosensis TaxID=1042984 RepID=A0A7W9V031_9ACTN|nr:ABC transporter permease [Streptomyces zagrosensis]MBB5937710.1 peptide/nickel transport system permease protein [Streptomyces zagrosensis]
MTAEPSAALPARAGDVRRDSLALRMLRDPMAVVGALLLALLVGLAVLGPWLWPYDHTTQRPEAMLAEPSAKHWLGTARLGEDVLAQCVRGLQKSLVIGVLVAVISTALATAVGLAAGYFGKRADRALMWGVDMLLILPSFLVVAVISPTLRDRSWLYMVLVIALFQWTLTARVIRARTLSLRGRQFVGAARYMGAGAGWIVRKHLVPHLVPLLVIDCTLHVSAAILSEAGLSYFGFGIQAPDVSLGSLVADGSGSALTYPWVFLAPVGFLVVTVTGVGLLGEALRRALDEGEAHAV